MIEPSARTWVSIHGGRASVLKDSSTPSDFSHFLLLELSCAAPIPTSQVTLLASSPLRRLRSPVTFSQVSSPVTCLSCLIIIKKNPSSVPSLLVTSTQPVTNLLFPTLTNTFIARSSCYAFCFPPFRQHHSTLNLISTQPTRSICSLLGLVGCVIISDLSELSLLNYKHASSSLISHCVFKALRTRAFLRQPIPGAEVSAILCASGASSRNSQLTVVDWSILY
jgi:hypothetical protein